ncbi:MAG: SusC/RagA family TonB-linked outer membrane protein [Cyclobacteriaceae bacterium]
MVGYGTQKKREVTGAMASMKSEAILKTATADLSESLQGNVAGVNIQASDGRPGARSNIQIRGVGSLQGNGSNRDALPVFGDAQSPLFVVDGIPFQGNPNLSPEQIESVEILKDGASAAVYGVRAANGVILITTKRGVEGKPKVQLRAYKGVQNITSGTPLMNALQQLYADDVVMAAFGTDPVTFALNADALDFDSNIVGDVENQNAAIENYSANVSGGTQGLTFNVNTNYFKQDGVLINSGFERLTTRLTGEITSGKFKGFASVGFTNENSTKEPWGLYTYAINQRPTQRGLFENPIIGPNTVSLDSSPNEILYSFISRELDNEDSRKINSTNIALKAEYEFIDGLKGAVNLGRNNWNFQRFFFQPQYLVYNRLGVYNATASRPEAKLNENFIFNTRDTFEGMLMYNKTFGGSHDLSLLAALTYERFDNKNVGAGVEGLLSNDTRVLGAGAVGIAPSGSNSANTIAGKLFRAQYNYNDKYMLSASIRRDGSSKFAAANRYENFFGISAGWNITEENFFKSAGLEFISNLKLRASYGEVGNMNSLGNYDFINTIEGGVDYVLGENEDLAVGAIQRGIRNPLIQWETKVEKNFGLDADFFGSRLSLNFDYYINNRQDMQLGQLTAPSSGTWPFRYEWAFNRVAVNVGDMANKGMELALKYRDKTNFGLNWNAGLNFTRNKNEITNLVPGAGRFGFGGGDPIGGVNGIRGDNTTFLVEGYEAGAFFLIPTDGVVSTAEELTEYRELVASANLGDLKYIDVNEDGELNDNDRIYMGSGQPEFELGASLNASYKGFDLFVQTYYVHDVEIFNGSKMYAYTAGRHLDYYYQWTPQNAGSPVPTYRQSGEHDNVRSRSDYFLEDGTYLRIRNITLGYSLPKKILGDGIEKVRVYFGSLNPFTFTRYDGYDPEVGGDGLYMRGVDQGNYPVARRFMMGLEVNF